MVKLKMVKAKKSLKVHTPNSKSMDLAPGRKVQFSDKKQVYKV